MTSDLDFKKTFGMEILRFAVQDVVFPDAIKNVDNANERKRLQHEADLLFQYQQEDAATKLSMQRHQRELAEAESQLKIAQLNQKKDALKHELEGKRLKAIADAVGGPDVANVIWALAAYAAAKSGNAFNFQSGLNMLGLRLPAASIENRFEDQDCDKGTRH
jgi:hypothetical protein